MIPDDDNAPQSELPPNVVTFNGEAFTFDGEPFTFGGRPLTLNGRQLTVNGQPLILGDDGQLQLGNGAPVFTGRDGTPLTTRDGTVLTGSVPDSDQPAEEIELPEPPEGQAFLVDSDGAHLTNSDGAFLTANADDHPADSLSTFAGESFLGQSFATRPANTADVLITGDGDPLVDENGNRLVIGTTATDDRSAAYHRELSARIERLEAALETYSNHLPPRNHNRPPELVEPDPIVPQDFTTIVKSVVELKMDLQQGHPSPEQLEAKASLFRRVAGAIAAWCGRKADAAVDAGIQWAVPAGIVWAAANPQEVQAALQAVAEVASAWANDLTAMIM